MTNFITQQDTLELIGRDDVSIVDGSWYLPAQGRDGRAEYNSMRLPGAVYFDINAIADPNTDLPHMLPPAEEFARQVSILGISTQHLIIVYDGPGLFSAPRVWWTFRVMGAPDVRILQGGIDEWKANNLPLETGNPNPARAHLFEPDFEADRVIDMDTLVASLNTDDFIVLDARPADRFFGRAKEPRPGLRSGHIPKSVNLPFQKLLSDGKLKSPEELDRQFTELGIGKDKTVITTCGSGVTAAILTLALEQAGRNPGKLFDGSWAQWGQPDGPEIESNE